MAHSLTGSSPVIRNACNLMDRVARYGRVFCGSSILLKRKHGSPFDPEDSNPPFLVKPHAASCEFRLKLGKVPLNKPFPYIIVVCFRDC